MPSFLLEAKTGRGQQRLQKINGWETKTMTRLFRLKRQKDETWVENHTRTCNMAKKIWVQMGLPFLFEKNCRKNVACHGVGLRKIVCCDLLPEEV